MNHTPITIRYKKLYPLATEPLRMTEHAAGFDLCAALENEIILQPGAWEAIPTGLALEIPVGYEAQIRPRSGLALKHGIGILNSPGTIDADYRGEVKIILINHSQTEFHIAKGMRIAQMIIARHIECDFMESEDLSDSQRSAGGFGHTGV